MPLSKLERRFLDGWSARADGAPRPVPQYRFGAHAVGGPGRGLRERLEAKRLRDWRFDFAWPEFKVAVELDGGVFMGGPRGHKGIHYHGDCQKNNAAVCLGWKLLRYTIKDLQQRPAAVVAQIVSVLDSQRRRLERADKTLF